MSVFSSESHEFSVSASDVTVSLDEGTLLYRIAAPGRTWEQSPCQGPVILLRDGASLSFRDAASIRHQLYESGAGTGILSSYADFSLSGKKLPFSFETYVWIEYATGCVRFELIPGQEGLDFSSLRWPAPFVFDTPGNSAVSVMPVLQGLLIPNLWENPVSSLPFD